MNVTSGTEFGVRLTTYKNVNEVAVPRILVDPDSAIRPRIHGMLVTTAAFFDAEKKKYITPRNIPDPPRTTRARKGCSKLWPRSKASKDGDATASDQAAKADAVQAQPEADATSQKDVAYLRETQGDVYFRPYVSVEKASLIKEWATAIEPDAADSEMNAASPEDQAKEPEPRKGIVGLKKRRAVGTAANATTAEATPAPGVSNEVAGVLTPMDPKPTSPRSSDVESKVVTTKPTGFSPPKIQSKALPLAKPSKPKKQTVFPLIDVSDDLPGPPNGKLPRSAPNENLLTGKMAMGPAPHSRRPFSNSLDLLGDIPENDGAQMPGQSALVPEKRQEMKKSDTVRSGSMRPQERVAEMSNSAPIAIRRTMKQKAPRPENPTLTKAQAKAKKDAALAEAWGSVPSLPRTGRNGTSKAPEPSQWKKAKLAVVEDAQADLIRDIFAQLDPTLNAARCFTGTLALEIEFGMIFLPSAPTQYTNRLFKPKAWNDFFRPKNNLKGPSTTFMNRLTTSGADVDFMVDLETAKDDNVSKIFQETPTARSVQFELHCKTKNNEQILVRAQEDGEVMVSRPEAVMGSVNLHCPASIWDMRVVVKGSQDYYYGLSADVDSAVQDLIDNLNIKWNGSEVEFSSKCEQRELQIVDVFMRSSTTHSRVAEDDPHGMQPCLRITEVQRLIVTHDGSNISARGLGDALMVDAARFWYEASVISPGIEEMFHPNKTLELGSCISAWQPVDILEEKCRPAHGQQSSNPKPATIASLNEMYLLADLLVKKIDTVGWANDGLGIEPDSAAIGSGSAIERSTLPPSAILPGSFLQTSYRRSADAEKAVDSVTLAGGQGGADYW